MTKKDRAALAHKKSDRADVAASDLDRVPGRAAQLIHGIVSAPGVRATLALAGLTPADMAEGRTRLEACLLEPDGGGSDGGVPEKRQAALAELNQWDEPAFARFGAALKRHAPGAYAYVFTGVEPSPVAEEAVRAIATFLARVDTIEAGTAGEVEACTLAHLEARGLTRDARKRLLALVATALAPGGPADTAPFVDPTRVDRLETLRAWYDEWAETARALIKGRRDLERLGLPATRQRRSKKAHPSEDAEPVAATERAPAPVRLYPAQEHAP